jgi:hypothetical protein
LCSAVDSRSQMVAEASETWKEMVYYWWVNTEIQQLSWNSTDCHGFF